MQIKLTLNSLFRSKRDRKESTHWVLTLEYKKSKNALFLYVSGPKDRHGISEVFWELDQFFWKLSRSIDSNCVMRYCNLLHDIKQPKKIGQAVHITSEMKIPSDFLVVPSRRKQLKNCSLRILNPKAENRNSLLSLFDHIEETNQTFEKKAF